MTQEEERFLESSQPKNKCVLLLFKSCSFLRLPKISFRNPIQVQKKKDENVTIIEERRGDDAAFF